MRCSIKSKIRFVAFLMTFCIMASVYGYSFSASAVKYEAESDNSSYLIIDEVVIEDEIRVLKESDLPETMSLSEAKNQGHILRKREVETGLTTAVLENEDGNAVTFRFLELVTVGEKPYAVLLPLDDDDDEGGVVIVEVVDLGLDSEHYDAVVDDDLNNRIFEQFRKEFGDKYEFE